ncbi:hypothetical protein Drorol1_Dr00003445 [Drosera rotundifolia]
MKKSINPFHLFLSITSLLVGFTLVGGAASKDLQIRGRKREKAAGVEACGRNGFGHLPIHFLADLDVKMAPPFWMVNLDILLDSPFFGYLSFFGYLPIFGNDMSQIPAIGLALNPYPNKVCSSEFVFVGFSVGELMFAHDVVQ